MPQRQCESSVRCYLLLLLLTAALPSIKCQRVGENLGEEGGNQRFLRQQRKLAGEVMVPLPLLSSSSSIELTISFSLTTTLSSKRRTDPVVMTNGISSKEKKYFDGNRKLEDVEEFDLAEEGDDDVETMYDDDDDDGELGLGEEEIFDILDETIEDPYDEEYEEGDDDLFEEDDDFEYSYALDEGEEEGIGEEQEAEEDDFLEVAEEMEYVEDEANEYSLEVIEDEEEYAEEEVDDLVDVDDDGEYGFVDDIIEEQEDEEISLNEGESFGTEFNMVKRPEPGIVSPSYQATTTTSLASSNTGDDGKSSGKKGNSKFGGIGLLLLLVFSVGGFVAFNNRYRYDSGYGGRLQYSSGGYSQVQAGEGGIEMSRGGFNYRNLSGY